MRAVITRFGRRPVAIVSAAGLAAAAAAAVLLISTAASSAASPTFTFDQGAYNPGLTGTTFSIRALECDRDADVQATGTMKFVDTTTGVTIGTATMGGESPFANCGQATITDSENLDPGNYKIQATYIPGGANPVPTSSPASYSESIKP